MTKKAWIAAGALLAATMGSLAWADEGRGDEGKGNNRLGIPQKLTAGQCDGTLCRLRVNATGNCKVSVEPEWIFIKSQSIQIVWEIQQGDYVFPEVGGVTFKPNYPMGDRELASSRVDERTWQVRDNNFQPEVARYNVTVVNRKTQESCSVDPGVVNDWP